MSSSNSPCAACKIQRRKCTPECVFAPYFPPDQPQKFASVHKVYGASNVTKLLNELNPAQREDAVNSLYYEAEQRILDPVYGCVGSICILQHRLKQLQDDLATARKELAQYIGPQAMIPMVQPPAPPTYGILSGGGPQYHHPHHQHLLHPHHPAAPVTHTAFPMMGIPALGPSHGGTPLVIREPRHHQHQQQQQTFETHQLAAAAVAMREQQHHQQQEMFRGYEQQPELMRFHPGGYDVASSVTPAGFNLITGGSSSGGGGGGVSASLALGSFDNADYQIQPQVEQQQQHDPNHQLPVQLMLQPHSQQQQQRSESDEGKSFDPSNC